MPASASSRRFGARRSPRRLPHRSRRRRRGNCRACAEWWPAQPACAPSRSEIRTARVVVRRDAPFLVVIGDHLGVVAGPVAAFHCGRPPEGAVSSIGRVSVKVNLDPGRISTPSRFLRTSPPTRPRTPFLGLPPSRYSYVSALTAYWRPPDEQRGKIQRQSIIHVSYAQAGIRSAGKGHARSHCHRCIHDGGDRVARFTAARAGDIDGPDGDFGSGWNHDRRDGHGSRGSPRARVEEAAPK